MRINTNVAALNSYNQLNNTNNKLSKSLERLSSGKRINGAADDAAGLAISEKMGSQTRGLAQAQRNAQDAISMNQTAEGALKESHSILQRMRELAVQSANDTNTTADRAEIQEEVNQLSKELTRISETTEFNTQKLLDGSLKNTFQIGANEGQNMKMDINNMSATALNVIDNTVTMESAGKGVEGVEADLDISVEDYGLEATKGDAIEAEITNQASEDYTINTSANNFENISSARGIDYSGVTGDVPTFMQSDATTENSIEIDNTNTDFDWSTVDTQTNDATIDVTKTAAGNLQVAISAETGDATSYSDLAVTDEYATQDADGNYVYDAHGVKFTVSEEDFNAMNDGDTVSINMTEANSAGAVASADLSANIGTKNDWTTNVDDGTNGISDAAFTGNEIVLDEANLMEGAQSVQIEGATLQTDGTAEYTVSIWDGADGTGNKLSEDVFTFDTAATAQSFAYDNHGVSFTLDQTDAVTLDMTHNIDYETEDKVGMDIATDQTLKLDIVNEDGTTEDVDVTFTAGKHSLEDIKAAINTEASSDIADVVDGELVINSLDTGTDASVSVEQDIDLDGGSNYLFGGGSDGSSGAVEDTGKDSSINFNLVDADGNTVDYEGTPQEITGESAESESISFMDDGITFSLENMASEELNEMSDSDVADYFSASGFERDVAGIDVTSQEAADSAISTIDEAIANVSSERSKLGAVQNRLEHTINNLNTAEENLTAAESRISDVDMAREMMNMSKQQILSQAGTAMMAQANQLPQGVLQLLG